MDALTREIYIIKIILASPKKYPSLSPQERLEELRNLFPDNDDLFTYYDFPPEQLRAQLKLLQEKEVKLLNPAEISKADFENLNQKVSDITGNVNNIQSDVSNMKDSQLHSLPLWESSFHWLWEGLLSSAPSKPQKQRKSPPLLERESTSVLSQSQFINTKYGNSREKSIRQRKPFFVK